MCRSWEHKSSSPPLRHSSHFVRIGWKAPIIMLILSPYIFLIQVKVCYASLKLPLQPLNNLPTSDYYYYRRTLVGFNLFLKNTCWVSWNRRKQFTCSSTGHTWRILYGCGCMHVCMLIPLKTKKFQWCSIFFSHSWFACLTGTHGHTNSHIHLYLITCISIFMHRHVLFNIFAKNVTASAYG